MSQDNLIQIVDENDNPTGVALRSEAQAQGLYHRIARVVIEDSDGRLLLQKRSPNSDTFPNCWDQSAGGHVDVGDSYETAAVRELFEEIGVSGVVLKEIGHYKTNGQFEWRKLNRFNKVFKAAIAPDTQLTPQPEEVTELRWFTVEEVRQLVLERPEECTSNFVDLVRRFYL